MQVRIEMLRVNFANFIKTVWRLLMANLGVELLGAAVLALVDDLKE